MPDDATTPRRTLRERLGLGQRLPFGDEGALERAVEVLHELGVRHVRAGVAWADFERPGGRAWLDRQMERLRGFEVLLTVGHTPPALGEEPHRASPPRRLADYGDFLCRLVDLHGERFAALELWSAPNDPRSWDFERRDPRWEKFAEMARDAGIRARMAGKEAVLGGTCPPDDAWVELVAGQGGLDGVDAVAIHVFPEVSSPDDAGGDGQGPRGWEERLEGVERAAGLPVWITATGLATYDPVRRAPAHEDLQVRWLERAARAPCERVYWCAAVDLDPEHAATGAHPERAVEAHLGLVRRDGTRKPAFERFRELLAEPVPAPGARS